MERYTFLNRMLMACALLGLATVAGANPPAGFGQEKAAEYAAAAFDRESALAERSAMHAWLMSESVSRGRGGPISANPTTDEKAAIDDAPRGMVPEIVGLTKSLSAAVNFSDVTPGQLNGRALGRPNGAMAGTSDGGYVFTTSLSSNEATALRVHFTGFRMPENTGVYLYTEDGQVFGPYTGRGIHGDGEFWSHTVMGDTVYLQVRHAGPVSAEDLRSTGFTIAGLGHVRPRWLGTCNWQGAAPCTVNACNVSNSAVDPSRDAVAHMQWISGPYIYICSGGLVADEDTTTSTPYFLSANHCISRGKDARNLENFFQFASCNNLADGQNPCGGVRETRAEHPQSLRTMGASIVSTNRTSDYTLFELNEDPPVGSAFLGWNSNPVANSNGAALYRISHPGGAPQSYSKHQVDTSRVTCSSWPRGNWIYSEDVDGATEGGSSGSPVVNAAGQIVGQLSGACGYNLSDSCDSASNATVDGAFAAYFDSVAPFLRNGSACTATETPEASCSDGVDNDCDGFIDSADSDCDGGNQCTVTESPEASCSDGVDNDCDGSIDFLDSDCGTGGDGPPWPAGHDCDTASDCISNKCTGKPGAKVCK
jgi:V8-like Glu-specific endopeptidase